MTVTDEMVETAWAAIVGGDIAKTCFNASIIRADLKTGLIAALAATPAVGGEALRDAIMGAARLYTHDHTTAHKIAETAMATLAAPPASPLRGVSGNEDLRNSIQRYIFDGAARDISPYDTATNILLFLAAQPVSPLRGIDRDLIALDAAHQIEALPSDLHEAQKTARIQLIVLHALHASPPEQPT